MANPNPLLLLFLLLLLLLSLSSPAMSLSSPAISLSEAELDAAVSALRSRGYSLFGNAISASDLRLDLLPLLPNSSSSAAAAASFTVFAPTDPALFALDMASSAASYLRRLRYHVAIGRLPLPALLALPNPSLVPTLLPGRRISVSRRRDSGTGADVLAADGVDVVAPGIFDGGTIAVHGLDGILSPVHHHAPIPPPQSPDPPSAPPDLSLPPSDPPDPRSPAPAPFDLGVLSPSMAPAIAAGASAPISTPSTAPISPPELGFPPEGAPPSASPAESPAAEMRVSWSGGVGAPASEGSEWCAANAKEGEGGGEGCGGVVAAYRGRPRPIWTAEIDDYGS